MLLAALSGTGQARHRQCMNAAPAKNAAGPLSGAWQARHRQCVSAAPAKNAAGQDRQGLNAAGSTQCCWARQAEAEHDH